MKRLFEFVCIAFAFITSAQDKYQVTIDLTKVNEDKVPIEIIVPAIEQENVEYHMAKIVPGTYSISDFGRFVVDFKALDVGGKELKVKKESTNRWTIYQAKSLNKITYWIEDSFDEFPGYGSNKLFDPGGVSIEADKNVFVMNTFGLIGYIDGMKFYPFDLTIHHDPGIEGATSLKKILETENSDTYSADDFSFLADAPLMYCTPDIVSKEIAGANIIVSVYSPNNILTATDIMDNIDELMKAQAKYLGGQLPVDRYVYLIYLFDQQTISDSYGALEHSYSSLYTLPEMSADRIGQIVKDVAAHEFFHIVTPLNIHSEEIHNFDYIDPKMSQHLWLYEGVTEYSSHHVQVKYGLYDLQNFLNVIREKMYEQDHYGVANSYTEFSKNILKPKNKKKYEDVYSGGALIAMCLDLTIMKSTKGEKNLQSVLRKLSKQYGPNKAFKDQELFGEIEKITTPEVGAFLKKYVEGIEPLPFNEMLSWAGIRYSEKNDQKVITEGNFIPDINENQEIIIAKANRLNDFGKDLGLKKNDVLISWNGANISIDNFAKVMQQFYNETEEGETVTVVVRRKVKDEIKEVKLNAKALRIEFSQKHLLEIMESPSPEQQKIRELWLKAE